MRREPCPHCGEIQYGPVQGIGYYCSQGSKCPGITFAKPITVSPGSTSDRDERGVVNDTHSPSPADASCAPVTTDTITITISRENAHECRIFGGPPAVIEAIEAALEGER